MDNIGQSIVQKSFLESQRVTAFLTQRGGKDVYILVDGAHRVAAQVKLEKPTVPTIVVIVPPNTDLTAWHFTSVGGSANSAKADTAHATFVSKLLSVLPILQAIEPNKALKRVRGPIDYEFVNATCVSKFYFYFW